MQPAHRPTQPDREPPCATPMPVPAPTGRVRSLPPATRPAIPEPSEAVARALGAGVRSIRYLHPDNGPSRRVEDWRPPAISDVAVLAQIEAHLAALDQALAPPHAGLLLTRVLALLSHYRSEPNPPAVETMVAEDWAEDLKEFPIWAIAEAARWWRRNRRFRPQICEIRKLCEDAVGDAPLVRDRLRAILERSERARNPLAERMAALASATFQRVPVA